MNNRIALVLKTKNISPSQLADDLGVQRSGISHIVNGRNKPSLEFIQKLIKLYPDISMQWILFGEGPMMNPYPVQVDLPYSGKMTDLFSEEKPKPRMMELFSTMDDQVKDDGMPEEERLSENNAAEPVIAEEIEKSELLETERRKIPVTDNLPISKNEPVVIQEHVEKTETRIPVFTDVEMENKKPVQPVRADRKISKILIFYNDRTFVEYTPGEE